VVPSFLLRFQSEKRFLLHRRNPGVSHLERDMVARTETLISSWMEAPALAVSVPRIAGPGKGLESGPW